MLKRIFLLFIVLALWACTACGATKILHCDHCGKEVTVQESSNMEEDWIVYCEECNESLFGDDPILGG